MKAIVLAILVLMTSAAATPATSNEPPRPKQDLVQMQQDDQIDKISSKIDISRLPSALLEQVPIAAQVMAMTQEEVKAKDGEEFINTFDEVCNTGLMKPNYAPSKDQMDLHLVTDSGEVSATLSQPQQILEKSVLREQNELVIYITGLQSNGENSPLNKLKEAYKCRGNVNLLVIDLGKHITNIQAFLTLNYEHVGEYVGEFLNELSKKISLNKVHLIGHGLGANVAGAAAKKLTDITGNLLPRITGLDPAVVCYPTESLRGLQKGDAEFIDAIHSSTYGYGKPQTSGDVDFYPNGPSIVQEGFRDLVSSHNIAVEFYTESVIPGNEENFLAQQCNSIKNLNSNACQRKQIPMGISTPKNASGNFFLQTKTMYPYGVNASQSAKDHRCWKN